jgi:predicted neutral ceramidase superfamily lipid hydrolase
MRWEAASTSMNEPSKDSTKLTFAIISANLLIMGLYDLILFSFVRPAFLADAMFLLWHVIILGILSLVFNGTKQSNFIPGLLISAILVALIGFGICSAMWN